MKDSVKPYLNHINYEKFNINYVTQIRKTKINKEEATIYLLL